MPRTLALIAIAASTGLDYNAAVEVVERVSPTLPEGDIDAGRAVAAAANEVFYP